MLLQYKKQISMNTEKKLQIKTTKKMTQQMNAQILLKHQV